MFDHLKTHSGEGQHEILKIKMAAHEIYERMMVAYWARDENSREYHLNEAEKSMRELMEIGARATEGGEA